MILAIADAVVAVDLIPVCYILGTEETGGKA